MRLVNNLESLLQSLCTHTSGETVTVGDMLDAVGRRSYGPILLLLGFIAISPLTLIPGGNWLVALITLLIAGQILFGKRIPWVPGRMQRISFPREALLNGAETLYPYARFVDRYLKPRFVFLTDPPFVQLVALVCISAALITFPLGLLPLGPVIPGLTILLFGLALTARDGFVLILAGGLLALGCLLLLRVWTRFNGG